VKKYSLAFFFLFISFITFFSCKKINESTNLGGDLIPAVDNVNTFEVALNTLTFNDTLNDSVRVGYSDPVALGHVVDPEFGTSHADLAFTITPSAIGLYPFINKDSVKIDSVILSLSYLGAWGDTMGNGIQTLRVFEIPQTAGFRDDSIYRYKDQAINFASLGSQLGSKTYPIKNLKDSIPVPRPHDSLAKVANVVRIKLDTSLGRRFAQYDTTSNSLTGGYHGDSSNGGGFRKLFKGLAIRADNSGNALAYFSLSDRAKTKLTVYFRATKNGITDTTSFDFIHISNGRANYVKHTPGAQWASYLGGTAPDNKIYIQTSPSGAYSSIIIPSLSTLGNKVIHKAEIIASVLPSIQNSAFTPPSRLFLDRLHLGTPNLFERDIVLNLDGTIDYSRFDGSLKNNAYKFDITRYVQGIVTRHVANDTLRLYAPYRTTIFASNINTKIDIPVLSHIAGGRVVLGGGNYVDSLQRLRLRIIYSNL
jgi:hypothetical protein